MKNYLVPTCTVFVQHGKDPCFPYSAPIVFCSVALMSEFDLVDVDFLLLNFLLDPSKQVIFNLLENFCLIEIKYESWIQALCTILRFLVGTLKEWKEMSEINFIMYI